MERLAETNVELLLEILENLSYREILRLCKSNEWFGQLCGNEELIYDGIMRRKLLEEGLAEIYVYERWPGGSTIGIAMIQDKLKLTLRLSNDSWRELMDRLDSEWLLRLVEERGRTPTIFGTPDGLNFQIWGDHALYDKTLLIHIFKPRGYMNYFVPLNQFRNILSVVEEIIERRVPERESHLVLMLDGGVEMVPHW